MCVCARAFVKPFCETEFACGEVGNEISYIWGHKHRSSQDRRVYAVYNFINTNLRRVLVTSGGKSMGSYTYLVQL